MFLLCAINEFLVLTRRATIPSLIDFGFVLALMPLTLHPVRRISSDARRLHELLSYLKDEVARRTEERDAARKALQETQDDLREVVSSLDEIVWEADAESLEILLVSAGAAKLLGYHSGDDRPTSFWPRYVHPDDRERLMVEARRAERTNETVRVEHRMLTADGRVLWFRDSLHPLAGPQGLPTRLRGVMSDITENRRAQDSLAESEARFQKIADAAPVLIWAHDECGRVTYVNRQALLHHGRSLEQLRGDGWTELVHADDRERIRSVVSGAVASNGSIRWISPARADGESAGCLARRFRALWVRNLPAISEPSPKSRVQRDRSRDWRRRSWKASECSPAVLRMTSIICWEESCRTRNSCCRISRRTHGRAKALAEFMQ